MQPIALPELGIPKTLSIQLHNLVQPFPNDKILDLTKSKAFADNKINLNERLKLVLGKVENIVGKGENAGYQHFLFFPQCFQKPSFMVVESQDCVVKS